MDTNKMREQFEAWWEENNHFMLGTRKVSKGDCFHIWQASREAMVVALPDHFRPSRHEIIFAIEAQGMKVAL